MSSGPIAHIVGPVRRWLTGLLLTACLAAPAAAQPSREYDLKAVFLYNFATFVEWPEGVRPAPGQPIIIGVLGRDPFGEVLDRVVAGEVLQTNPLEVRRYQKLEQAAESHILFICASEAADLPEILAFLRNKPVLTVTDIPRSADSGVIMTFSTGNRIQLQINAAAAQRAGLNISSKLLRVAKVVGPVPVR